MQQPQIDTKTLYDQMNAEGLRAKALRTPHCYKCTVESHNGQVVSGVSETLAGAFEVALSRIELASTRYVREDARDDRGPKHRPLVILS